MKRIFRSLAALLIIAISFSAISFAWLASGKYLNFPSSFGGSAVSAYFAGGDGSEEKPFKITNAVHLYNLAWLQYLGYFNRREGFNNGLDQTYFELGGDVDMKGRAIPPIGTEEYPFIGNFNGNGKTVKKLTISNKRGTGDLVYAPTNANFSSANNMLRYVGDDSKEIEIVGMFGVTGDYNGYFNKYKNAGHTVDGTVASVRNFYVDKIHVRSNSAKTLAGLAAGYIGGNFSNVGVYRSDVNFAANAQSIADNTIVSSGVLSQYSLVGAYNEDTITWDDESAGGTTGWGGSIDMKSLFTRLKKFKSTPTSYVDTNFNDTTSGNIRYYDEKKGSVYFSSLSNESILYLYGGKKDYTYSGEVTVNNTTTTRNFATYVPLLTDNNGNVINKNTGYIASGPKDTMGDIRVKAQKQTGSNGALKYSLTDIKKPYASGNSVKIYTRTAKDNDFVSFTDAHGSAEKGKEKGLVKYENAKTNFDKMFTDSSDSALVYGMHFMNAPISKENVYKADHVMIDNEEKTDYQMVANSIDFKAKKKGYINFFAGTYYNNSDKNFFSLHEVKRKGNDVAEVKSISKIYAHKTDSKADYIYLYDDNTYSGDYSEENYELAFDVDWIINPKMNKYSVYYFEIPVNAGEYALGSASTGNGAYLMYLDIGANGNSEGSEKTYTMDKVRFVNSAKPKLDGNGVVDLSDFDAALITLDRGNFTQAAVAIFERDTVLTGDKYRLAYRVEYLNHTPVGGSVYSKDGLQKSSDETDD